MADPRPETTNDHISNDGNPKPEVLSPREHDISTESVAEGKKQEKKTKKSAKSGRLSLKSRYHLSHKATFIGLVVVIAILAINVAIFAFVIGDPFEDEDEPSDQVTINQEALEGLGINRTAFDDLGAELTVGPNANFERDVQVAGNLNIGGELTLNERLSAMDASVDTLQAGDTALEQLNVNGDATITNIVARQDITAAGTTRLQGPTTISNLLTVENNANISGNLTVGGTLSVNTFNTNNLTVGGTTTFGGPLLTRGSAPSASAGPAVGSNGTVSISGNDTSGTVGFNAGVGAGNGIVATVTFSSSYSSTPNVVITPVGNVGNFYISRNQNGFSIGVGNSVSPGGYAFDYIVMQ